MAICGLLADDFGGQYYRNTLPKCEGGSDACKYGGSKGRG